MVLLAWFLPGALLVAHLRLPDLDTLTAGLMATGLGVCWFLLITWLVHWLPGPIGAWQLLLAYEVGAVTLLVGLLRRGLLALVPVTRKAWWYTVLLLALAVLLRLPGLGYHEFHDDEAFVLGRAREAIQGEEDALARHTKGPGEILTAVVVYRTLGTIDETTSRFPFALASVASVLAAALVGYRLFSLEAGFWAGVLLAFNGFALALSRIVQYQAIVLLLMPLLFLAAWQFARSGSSRWFLVVALLGTFGMVMHYEVGLMAPVVLVMSWQRWWRASRQTRWAVLATAAIASFVVAAAYLPIFLHPYRSTVQSYFSVRFGTLGNFDLPFFIEIGTFYNSTYFLVGLIGLVTFGIVVGWRVARAFTILLTLWFAPFLVVYLIVIRYAGTHYYAIMQSWSLLAALGLVTIVRARGAHRARAYGARLLVTGWLALSAGYLYLMFFRQAPEYLLNFERGRLPLYWAPYDPPSTPRFGFPMREGWRVLGVLNEWHFLGDTYNSNDSSEYLRLYLGGFDRVAFDQHPDFIFVAAHPRELNPEFAPEQLDGYQRVGEVRVREEPRIALYAREPLALPYVIYDAEAFTPVWREVVPPLQEWPRSHARLINVTLNDVVTLEEVALGETSVERGENLHITLSWHVEQLLAQDYKLFVHLGTPQPLAQWDGLPGLNTARTTTWNTGETFEDHVLLPIPQEMPAGRHQLVVGLYDPNTGERLGDQAVPIGAVRVR